MDERLEKALNYSNYMVTYNNQKLLLKEKFNENLHYFVNGAQFIASVELINYLNFLSNKDIKETIILDANDNPVKIENLSEFFENIQHIYFIALNQYYQELSNLKLKRKVEKLVE